jgi:hypothetical protein
MEVWRQNGSSGMTWHSSLWTHHIEHLIAYRIAQMIVADGKRVLNPAISHKHAQKC